MTASLPNSTIISNDKSVQKSNQYNSLGSITIGKNGAIHTLPMRTKVVANKSRIGPSDKSFGHYSSAKDSNRDLDHLPCTLTDTQTELCGESF